MKLKLLFFTIGFIIHVFAKAQTVRILMHDSSKVSFRGLSVVTNKIIWVSGSKGTVGLSTDGGNEWKWIKVPGYENRDFRDIEAFDENNAIIMAVGEPAVILKTNSGGNFWKLVFEDKRKGMFLDAMEFWNEKSGIVVGDPIDGKIFIARTFDGGENWRGLPEKNYPIADNGEAMFAASGTNVVKINSKEAVIVTGGKKSRLFMKDEKKIIPIIQGKESTGANSIAINNKTFVVVGGDFYRDTLREMNCAISKDGGKTFIIPQTPPFGYRSCVEFVNNKTLIACGTSGVDVSYDFGMNWKNISLMGFHVCRKAKKGNHVFVAGVGIIGKIEF